jgi:hypothetical protein
LAIELVIIHSGKMQEDYDFQKSKALGNMKLEEFVKEFVFVYNQY